MRLGLRQLGAAVWLLVLLAALVLQVVVGWPFRRPSDWLALLAITTLIFKHLYAHCSWLYLFLQKCWLWLTNVTTEWSLDVQLRLADEEPSEGVSQRLEKVILGRYTAALDHVKRSGPLDFEFRLARQFSAMATVADDDGSPVISIQIMDMSVGFRDSIRRIEEHICPFFEYIEHQFHVKPDGRKYGLIAHFLDQNPYFGVFIQKLRIERVDTFNLTIKSDTPSKMISVKRDRVELLAKSLDAFRSNVLNTFRLGTGEM